MKIGSLFSGYGGLDLAVQNVTGAKVAWHCEWEDAHRLSSSFTEWMMGLPENWICGHDLKRNDELKLAGNGVVPQQAELALRLLLNSDEE